MIVLYLLGTHTKKVETGSFIMQGSGSGSATLLRAPFNFDFNFDFNFNPARAMCGPDFTSRGARGLKRHSQ
jgi:hypothetical protein